MASNVRGFGVLPELHPFDDRFFLVTSIHLDPHFIVYAIGIRVEGRCTELFPKYLDEVSLPYKK